MSDKYFKSGSILHKYKNLMRDSFVCGKVSGSCLIGQPDYELTDLDRKNYEICLVCYPEDLKRRILSDRDMNLSMLQTSLPWTVRYSQDFRANPMSHKDFSHAILHAQKALGKLADFVDRMDHDRTIADMAAAGGQVHGAYVADLVVCALRMANTFPGQSLDLAKAVVERIESKNNVKLNAVEV